MEFGQPNIAVYLDMDGVLADFDKKARQIFPKFDQMADYFAYGKGSKTEYNKLSTQMLFKILRTPNFWENLEWQPGGQQLFQYVSTTFNREQYGILTAPLRGDINRCIAGKKHWCATHLGNKLASNRFFASIDKNKYMGAIPGKFQVLIDDRPKNIDKWRSGGGIGILHKSANRSITELKQIIKHVHEMT